MIQAKIGYVNLFVTDLARSLEFFEKTLGLDAKVRDTDFGYASLDGGPVSLGLAQVDPEEGENAALVGRVTGFGFVVSDLVAAHADLERQGVRFPMEPSKQPWGGFMALFEDPDGNTFYLDQIPPPE